MTRRESRAAEAIRRDWIIRFAIAALAGLMAALLGPFTTYERFTFVERLVYWGGLFFILMVPSVLVRAAVLRVLRGSELVLDLIGAAAIAAVIAPPVWAFNVFVMRFDVYRPRSLAEHLVIGLLIALIPVALRQYVRLVQGDGPVEPGVQAEVSPFLRRLEPDKRGDIWRVSADDHQLSVWTSNGESRIRMRFSDALQELDGLAGAMVHRSHWVAFSQIREVVPDGRKHKIIMECGTEVPVSQNRADALRAAGVLRD